MGASRCARLLVAAMLASCLAACAIPGARLPSRVGAPLRVSETLQMGDARRQASTRLVLEGLDADAALGTSRAMSRYERAIQVDPTNPYAYLAIARHHVAEGDGARALEYLDQAETLLVSESLLSPRVDVHLVGLRGAALDVSGRRRDAQSLLSRAREQAPEVWGDGALAAGELR